MSTPAEAPIVHRLVVAIAFALVTFGSFSFSIPFMPSVASQLPQSLFAVGAPVALGVMLAGLSLLAHQRHAPVTHGLPLGLATLVLGSGLLDVWRSAALAGPVPAQGVVLVLAGGALLALSWVGSLAARAFQVLRVALLVTSGFSVLAFALGATRFVVGGVSVVMPVLVAVALFLLGVGLTLTRLHASPLHLLWADSAGGVLLRRVLPGAILFPPCLSVVALQLVQQEVMSVAVGFALVAAITSSVWTVRLAQHAKALHASEDTRASQVRRMQALTAAAHDAIITANRQGRIVYVNAAAERMFQLPANDLLGQPLTLLMPAVHHQAHSAGLARFLETGEARVIGRSVEVSAKRQDGSIFPIELSLSVWHDDGEPFFTGIVRDISERVQAQVNQARLAAVVEASSEAITSRDMRDTVLTWNPAAERLYGYSANEMIGQSIEKLLPSQRLDEERRLLADVRAGRSVTNVETERVRKDGQRVMVSVSYAPLRDAEGRVVGVSSVARDVAREREAHERVQSALAYTQALARVMRLLELEVGPDDAARHVGQTLGPVLRLGWVGLIATEDQYLQRRTVWQSEGATVRFLTSVQKPVPPDSGLAWTALKQRTPLFVDDYAHDPRALSSAVEDGVTAVAFIPLRGTAGTSSLILTLCRFTHPGGWSPEDRDLIEAAAQTINVALERAEHLRALEVAATTDGLTGLRNRRAFELDVHQESTRAAQEESPVGLLILDLDGLKLVNDTAGHQRGDELLCAFGQGLSTSFRRADRVYRLGGDEFAVLIKHSGPEAVSSVLEKVRQTERAVHDAGFREASASAGVAFYPAEGASLNEVLRLADARMYDQKRLKRSRKSF